MNHKKQYEIMLKQLELMLVLKYINMNNPNPNFAAKEILRGFTQYHPKDNFSNALLMVFNDIEDVAKGNAKTLENQLLAA
jgi:hypothetical protein